MRHKTLLYIVFLLALSNTNAQTGVSIKNATYIDKSRGIIIDGDSIIDYFSTSDGPYLMCITIEIEEDSLMNKVPISVPDFYLWLKSSRSMLPLYGSSLSVNNNSIYIQNLITSIPDKYLPFNQRVVAKSFINKINSKKIQKKLQKECFLYYYDSYTSYYKEIPFITVMIYYSDEDKDLFLESYPKIPKNKFLFDF